MEISEQELTQALMQARAYPHAPAEVSFLQTHISLLFFAGDRVYKVHKAVDLGFLDFTSLAARRHDCLEELRLNRRLAPQVYLGMVDIVRDDQGQISIQHDGPGKSQAGGSKIGGSKIGGSKIGGSKIGGSKIGGSKIGGSKIGGSKIGGSEIIDHAVEMQRLPAHRMLDHLLDHGNIDNEMMRHLAAVLARFHDTAATGEGIDRHGDRKSIQANCLENFRQTQGQLPQALHQHLQSWTNSKLQSLQGLMQQRVAEHKIREGHGDLHAGNICLLDDTEKGIVIYDCLEFAARLRCGDVANDLAFLLMDLDHRGFRAFAKYLWHEYLARIGDASTPDLLNFYKCYRAMVRAKVACLGHVHSKEPPSEALDYLHLAASYALPPGLILTCGLPASGKSYLAKLMARPLGASICNSDRTRKRLHGQPLQAQVDQESFGSNLYSAKATSATYAALLDKARRKLLEGRWVIVDAGNRCQQQRQPFLALARELQVPLVLLHLDPPEQTIRQRLQARAQDAHAESDAGPLVYAEARKHFQAPDEFPQQQLCRQTSLETPQEVLTQVLQRVLAQLS